ncbi:MAG: macro domain-containing protein [Candidatus Protochlamydia sp.]|nr:macro domain-containing protein [Candidatus Protochlamydia sp.]
MNVVRSYPGDLTVQQKNSMRMERIDNHKVQILFNGNPAIQVTIRRQNMFQSGAQVIINAANTTLTRGGGIDGAIHDAAGGSYAQAHSQLQAEYGGLGRADFTRGFAAMIQSGELKAKHRIERVIAVAGPMHASTPENDAALYSCYYNSLVLADSENIFSLAFPSISTGIFRFPKERAAAISLRALYDFIEDHPNTTLLQISIHFLENEPYENLQNYIDAAQ